MLRVYISDNFKSQWAQHSQLDSSCHSSLQLEIPGEDETSETTPDLVAMITFFSGNHFIKFYNVNDSSKICQVSSGIFLLKFLSRIIYKMTV